MGLACLFGHKWDGCKCTRCGATRDEDHDWNGCKCKRCGEWRDKEHPFEYKPKDNRLCAGKCPQCGHTTEKEHRFKAGSDPCHPVCEDCGYVKEQVMEHDFQPVEGKCHDVCTKCGQVARAVHHQWQPTDKKCEEKCVVCGETRTTHRMVNGKCTVCGYQDAEAVMDKCLNELLAIFPTAPLDSAGHKRFDAAHREEVRAIGERLNQLGGMRAMQKVGMEFARRNPIHARKLETTWDGIGSWMG